jgi:hypothetical protein
VDATSSRPSVPFPDRSFMIITHVGILRRDVASVIRMMGPPVIVFHTISDILKFISCPPGNKLHTLHETPMSCTFQEIMVDLEFFVNGLLRGS